METNIDQVTYVQRKDHDKDMTELESKMISSSCSEKEESDGDDDSRSDEDRNVVFCMWGHENCKTRSHYRYNWQWDYVTKYAEQHNKHLVQAVKTSKCKGG